MTVKVFSRIVIKKELHVRIETKEILGFIPSYHINMRLGCGWLFGNSGVNVSTVYAL